MVFYCSETCQRKHGTKQGHKQACRKQGQIEIGDNMAIITKEDNKKYYEFVDVIADLGGGQWQIAHRVSKKLATVDGADLFRLRPPSTLK
jgi:hypothetical protein